MILDNLLLCIFIVIGAIASVWAFWKFCKQRNAQQFARNVAEAERPRVEAINRRIEHNKQKERTDLNMCDSIINDLKNIVGD